MKHKSKNNTTTSGFDIEVKRSISNDTITKVR